MASSNTETTHPNVDLPHRKLSKKPKSSITEVAPLYIPTHQKRTGKPRPPRDQASIEDMARKQTTLGSEPEAKDPKQLTRTTFIWPKHSNQAYANAKNFYKKFIDTETKTKRLKLFHNIQKKKTETTPEVEQKMKERDMNRLIETNLRLFRNMNNIFGSYANPNSSKYISDSSFMTQGEQLRQKEYRSVSTTTKKYDSKIIGYGRSQIFIPVETNFGGDDDSRLNISSSVFEDDFLSRKRVSTTITHSERRDMQTAPSPNKSRRVSAGAVKKGNNEKKNLSIDYYVNKKRDSPNKLAYIDLAPSFGPENINTSSLTVNNIIYEKPVYKIPDNLNQALASLIHESSSINKNTLNLMTKMVRNQAQKEEARNKSSSRGTPQKYKQRDFWILNEKSKRSSSITD